MLAVAWIGGAITRERRTVGVVAMTLCAVALCAPSRAHAWGRPFSRAPTTPTPLRARAWGAALGSANPARRTCGGAHLQPTRENLAQVTAATRCLIEREREAHRLGLLHSNGTLQRVAASQAREMVIGDYFGDNSLSGSTPIQRVEVSAYASRTKHLLVAQNIGWGTGGLATPAAMVRGWMLSPPHRHIMLTGGFRDIGVGIAPAAPPRLTDGLPGATYTIEFALRR
jgi:uncharacterized protein YkwD